MDFRDPRKLGKGTANAYKLIRKFVPTIKEDRIFSMDIENIVNLIRTGRIVRVTFL